MILIKASDMPVLSQRPKIINHWTGGSYNVSELDRLHYHFIVTGAPAVEMVRGYTPISQPCAHTYGFNWEIGVSCCAMAGATQGGSSGRFPLTKEQWEMAARINAELALHYKIPVTKTEILQHGEVTKYLGVDQWGKWDMCFLPWMPKLGFYEVGDLFRTKVVEYMEEIEQPAGMRVTIIRPGGGFSEYLGKLMNGQTYLGIKECKELVWRHGPLTAGSPTIEVRESPTSTSKHLVPYMVIGGVGYFPIRTAAEKLGWKIKYDPSIKTVIVRMQ